MKMPLPLRNNDSGSVAVTVAFIMTLLLGIMAFTMDAGYLYTQDNRRQNAVEAAALAGVRELCSGEWEETARTIAGENGIENDPSFLLVETGFYDALDEYSEDLGDYKDFGPPPSGQYENAVHVRLVQTVESLSGMNKPVSVVAEAVAYLVRIDIASLDPSGHIRLGHNSKWENTVFFSNGDIQQPGSVPPINGKSYDPPVFTNCLRFAAGEVASCSAEKVPFGWGGFKIKINWDSGSPFSGSDIMPGVDPITEIRPVDEISLDYWRSRADKIYTPDQAGQDHIFYGEGKAADGGSYYFLDPAAAPGGGRRVIFFDTDGDTGKSVLIGPASGTAVAHTPNGNTIANLTFVATCPVRVQNRMPTQDNFSLNVGALGDAQAVIISTDDIEIYTRDIIYKGVVFRAGKDFITFEVSSPDTLHQVRVIADGSVHSAPYSAYSNDPGLSEFYNDSRFGPPCPPGMARLGRLEAGE